MLSDEPTIDAVKRAPTKPAAGTHDTKGMWSVPASVGSAILSSACCWLPLMLLAFGMSAGGVTGFFESVRLYFLGAAVIFLGAGFYFAYLHKPACELGAACAVPNPKLQRLNRSMLWVATVFVVGFALFPYYSPTFVRAWAGSSTTNTSATTPDTSDGPTQAVSQSYAIDGMTCRACAATLEVELAKLPGVDQARVSYALSSAELLGDTAVGREAVRAAVERAGFKLGE